VLSQNTRMSQVHALAIVLCCFPVPTATEEEEVGESLGGKSWSFEILRVSGVGDFTLESPEGVCV